MVTTDRGLFILNEVRFVSCSWVPSPDRMDLAPGRIRNHVFASDCRSTGHVVLGLRAICKSTCPQKKATGSLSHGWRRVQRGSEDEGVRVERREACIAIIIIAILIFTVGITNLGEGRENRGLHCCHHYCCHSTVGIVTDFGTAERSGHKSLPTLLCLFLIIICV